MRTKGARLKPRNTRGDTSSTLRHATHDSWGVTLVRPQAMKRRSAGLIPLPSGLRILGAVSVSYLDDGTSRALSGSVPVDDPPPGEIVGGQFYEHAIAQQNADVPLPHFA